MEVTRNPNAEPIKEEAAMEFEEPLRVPTLAALSEMVPHPAPNRVVVAYADDRPGQSYVWATEFHRWVHAGPDIDARTRSPAMALANACLQASSDNLKALLKK